MEKPFPEDLSFPNFGFAGWRGPAFHPPRSHRHHEIELNFVEDGRITYLMGGRRFVVEPGRFIIFWASTPHQMIHFSPSAILSWVTIPLGWFLQWQLPRALTQPLLRGKILRDPDPGYADLDPLLVRQWSRNFSEKSPAKQRILLLEVEARLRRFADSLLHNTKDRNIEPAPMSGAGKVEQMARFIAEHYTEPLKTSDVARAVGLHPNYAMRLFQKNCKTTLIDYITRHRISHAQRLLATTDQKILEIGLDSGFGSASQFYLAFKQGCGQTPKAYRSSLQRERS